MAVIARGHDGDDLAVAHHRLVVEQHRLGIGQLELHHAAESPSSRWRSTASRPMKSPFCVLHGKAETGLQHVVLVGDVMAEMPEGLFDAAGIERVQPAELQPVIAPASVSVSNTCAAWSVET
jgi:hypothetical protein